MRHIRNFFYNISDILLAIVIVTLAAGMIYWRMQIILDYPKTAVSDQVVNEEVITDDAPAEDASAEDKSAEDKAAEETAAEEADAETAAE